MIEYQDDFVGLQLKKLKQSGGLDDNAFAGQPLDLRAYFKAPKETRAINKFLHDAGFKPPKLQALQELREKEAEYASNPTETLRSELVQARLRYDVLR